MANAYRARQNLLVIAANKFNLNHGDGDANRT